MSLNQPNTPIPTNLSSIKPPPRPSGSALDKAQKESEFYISSDKKKREHQREQQAKGIIHFVIQANIVAAGALIFICIVVRGLHLVISDNYLWLGKEKLELLDSLAKYAGSGAVGSLLTRYLNKNTDNGVNPMP